MKQTEALSFCDILTLHTRTVSVAAVAVVAAVVAAAAAAAAAATVVDTCS